jgi:hypothetical protein
MPLSNAFRPANLAPSVTTVSCIEVDTTMLTAIVMATFSFSRQMRGSHLKWGKSFLSKSPSVRYSLSLRSLASDIEIVLKKI